VTEHLGIARNILKTRLDTLAAHGMLERRQYQHNPDRYEYLPTVKALDLIPAILALVARGDRWTAPGGPPVIFTHRTCAHDTSCAPARGCSDPPDPLRLAVRGGQDQGRRRVRLARASATRR
jgi:HxlR-like helix-turn-helix protein